MTRQRWFAVGAIVVVVAAIGVWALRPGTDRAADGEIEKADELRPTTTALDDDGSVSSAPGETDSATSVTVGTGTGSTASTRPATTGATNTTATTATTTTTGTNTTMSERLPPGQPAVTGGSRAATSLRARSYCDDADPNRGLVDLAWTPASQRGSEQRVQVTNFPDGFESGQYDLSPALDPARSTFTYTEPRGTSTHLWRVVTRHGETWVASETAKFNGPGCVGDSPST